MSTDKTYEQLHGWDPFPPKVQIYHKCKKCCSSDTYTREEGADCDGGQNCIVRYCRTCGYMEEI